MYLVKADLYILLYQEIIEIITRGDDTLITRAINTGVSEAKSYLSRFNLVALFGTDVLAPTVVDENLKSKVIDLVCWQLIKLSNPNIDLKLFRTNYEDALTFFTDVKKSQESPDGWLYKTDDADTPFPEGNIISSSTNIKRNNHW